jgi:hypothetical protein
MVNSSMVYIVSLSILNPWYIHCFHQFGYSDFIRDVCLSDYIHWNFDNPRYYAKYWYGFEYTYPPDLLDLLENLFLEEIAYARFVKFSDKLTNRVWGYKRTFDKAALKPGQNLMIITE